MSDHSQERREIFTNVDEIAWAAALGTEVLIEMLIERGVDEELIERAFATVSRKAATAGLPQAAYWLHLVGKNSVGPERRAERALARDPARGKA